MLDNAEDIVDVARALLLDLRFSEYIADTFQNCVVLLRIVDAVRIEQENEHAAMRIEQETEHAAKVKDLENLEKSLENELEELRAAKTSVPSPVLERDFGQP